MTAEDHFNKLVKKESQRNYVKLGKMMSAPGIRYKDKNYAFFFKEKVGFKLGKEFNIDGYELSQWEHLSPFKTKPPLTAWYIIGVDDVHVWEEFAALAFDYIKAEIG